MDTETTPNLSKSFQERSNPLDDTIGSPSIEFSDLTSSILLQGGVADVHLDDVHRKSIPSIAELSKEKANYNDVQYDEIQPSHILEFESLKQKSARLHQSTPLASHKHDFKESWHQEEPININRRTPRPNKENQRPYPIYIDDRPLRSHSTEFGVYSPYRDKVSTATSLHEQVKNVETMSHYQYPLSPDQKSPLSQSTARNSPHANNLKPSEITGKTTSCREDDKIHMTKLSDYGYLTIGRQEFESLLVKLSNLERDNAQLIKENEQLTNALKERGNDLLANGQAHVAKSTQTNSQERSKSEVVSPLSETNGSKEKRVNANPCQCECPCDSHIKKSPVTTEIQSEETPKKQQSQASQLSAEETTNDENGKNYDSNDSNQPVSSRNHNSPQDLSKQGNANSSTNTTLVSQTNFYPKFDINRYNFPKTGPKPRLNDLDKVDQLSHDDLVYCVKTTLAIFIIQLDVNYEVSLLRQSCFISMVLRFVKIVHKLLFPERLDISCSKWFEAKMLKSDGEIDDRMEGLQCRLNEMVFHLHKLVDDKPQPDGKGK